MSLTQCSALKSDGDQCKRVARAGSKYCHSHRDYKPQCKESLAACKMKSLPDLHICFSDRRIVSTCADCNHLIKDHAEFNYQLADVKILTLCAICFDTRQKIENHIQRIVDEAPGHTLATTKIYESLEEFGIPQEWTEQARLRLHKLGKLKST